jgi:hypothetical protein
VASRLQHQLSDMRRGGSHHAVGSTARRARNLVGAIGLVLLIGGCAQAPFVSYENGPVALYIGDVRHVCAASGVLANRGCTMRYPNGRIEVYCAAGDYVCIAHELRHVADPHWRHDIDARHEPRR